jgi:hypothetical protein
VRSSDGMLLLLLHAAAVSGATAAGPLRQDLYKAIEVSSVDAFQVCVGPEGGGRCGYWRPQASLAGWQPP